MALNLTPCIYPLIPITVSYFGGRSETAQGSKVVHGTVYILGLSVTNSTLGAVAALTGGLVGALLQHSIVLAAIAAILLVFALSLFGFWEIRLPARFNALASRTYSGYGGSLFMGLTLGIIAAPCIGPFVVGLLSWIAGIGKIWFGFTVFFILSVGMGLPLFLLALFSSNLDRLPRSGEWMIWVKKLMGWILVVMAVYFLKPLLAEPWGVIFYTFTATAAGFHLGWLEKSAGQTLGFRRLRVLVGIACLVAATFAAGSYLTRAPGIEWISQTDGIDLVLAQAREDGQPVIIDFSADWCAPCRELDETTFRHPQVRAAAKQIVMVKIDLTRGPDDAARALLEQYQVRGVPTIVFLDSSGRERGDLRLVDYRPPEEFLQRMKQIL
jgi:thiol:disulfide interchange protein DsbD